MELLAGKTAVEVFFAQKGLQKIGVLDESFAQKAAVAKDNERVVCEKIVSIE